MSASGLLAESTFKLCLWVSHSNSFELSGNRGFLDIINILIYFQRIKIFPLFQKLLTWKIFPKYIRKYGWRVGANTALSNSYCKHMENILMQWFISLKQPLNWNGMFWEPFPLQRTFYTIQVSKTVSLANTQLYLHMKLNKLSTIKSAFLNMQQFLLISSTEAYWASLLKSMFLGVSRPLGTGWCGIEITALLRKLKCCWW